MDVIVGVYIRGTEAFLSYPELGSVRQVRTMLPFEAGEEAVFRDRGAFRTAFAAIARFLKAHELLADPGYILCIPDSFGIGERIRIFQHAESCGVPLLRQVTYTMAMGLAIALHREFEGSFIAAYERGGSLWMCEYDLGDDVLEKCAAFQCSQWKRSDSQCLSFENDRDFRFRHSEAGDVFFSGSTESLQRLTECIKATLREERMISVHPFGEWNIPIGLAVQCAVLGGEPVLEGRKNTFLALDTFSPYTLCVSWGDEMFDLLYSDTTIPTMAGKELLSGGSWPKSAENVLKIYENRGGRYKLQGIVPVQPDMTELKDRDDLLLQIDVDASDRFVLSILSGKDTLASFPASRMMTPGQTGDASGMPQASRQTGDDAGTPQASRQTDGLELLTALLPVFNNLSYGARYSEDSNPYARGLANIFEQTRTVLKNQGVELIDRTGVLFDVRYHYAVEHVTDPAVPENTVVKIVETGCIDHGKVIRPARVVVAN